MVLVSIHLLVLGVVHPRQPAAALGAALRASLHWGREQLGAAAVACSRDICRSVYPSSTSLVQHVAHFEPFTTTLSMHACAQHFRAPMAPDISLLTWNGVL
jgi:hypothetical protein